jgi:hypothetical protein
MSRLGSLKFLTLALMRVALFVLALLSGFYTAFISQASSPDYRWLFWSILPLAGFHFALVTVYCLQVRHWTRWIALSIAIITLAFLSEMILRVWL